MIATGRWMFIRVGHERTLAVLQAHQETMSALAKARLVAPKGTPTTAVEVTAANSGVLVSGLAWFGMALSADAAEREAFAADLRLLSEFKAKFEILEADHFYARVDFIKTIQALGLPVTAGMTQAEAAAAFLQYAKKLDVLLGKIQKDLSLSPWDYGGDGGDGSYREWFEKGLKVVSEQWQYSATTGGSLE